MRILLHSKWAKGRDSALVFEIQNRKVGEREEFGVAS